MSATQPASTTELKEYALRKLGKPVVEVNLADEQMDDLIDEAIQYFQQSLHSVEVVVETTGDLDHLVDLEAVEDHLQLDKVEKLKKRITSLDRNKK